EKVNREQADVVLVSRYLQAGDSDTIPFVYRFYQACFRTLVRILMGIRIKDTTYAYRAFRISFIKTLHLESGGFEVSPEITFKSVLAGGHIVQIPGRQGRRIKGESKFIFSREGKGYARILLKAGLARGSGRWVTKRPRSLLKMAGIAASQTVSTKSIS